MAQSNQSSTIKDLLNLPNLLSLARLALVPVFLWLLVSERHLLAILVLAVAGLTDFLDGYFARRLNLMTKIGMLLDPVADRLYILATLIGLSITGHIPAWLAIVIIFRDILMLVSYPVLATLGYRSFQVHFLGKAGTFALLYSFPLLLMGNIFTELEMFIKPAAWAFALWGAYLYWWSGFVYLVQLVKLVRFERLQSANVRGGVKK
jgi:cardiolipin synthase